MKTKHYPMDYQKKQPIIEAYTCIQTEGSQAGKPHFLIRTTGCTHRCYFGEGGWCDSWYTSIHPEKGSWTLNQISDLFKAHPHIKHLMISGGSPTMHPELVNELIYLANDDRKMFTTLETEGSHFIQTDLPIDLISLSVKFSNSMPILGVKTPQGKVVDQKMIDQHQKFRFNIVAIKKMLEYHKDYHFKPVVDRNDVNIWDDINWAIHVLDISKNKVWVMPAGDTLDKLQPNYSYVMEECIKRGFNFTGRAHIVAYNDKRGV
jgi:organic radical activating enzyme